MPGCARAEVVEPGIVGLFHCWGRCCRRAWLCGVDPATGTDYEHRRSWIRQLQEQLAGLFAVEIEFHAEMSNHLHLVLRTRPDVVDTWSDEEVVRRMLTIHKLTQNLEGKAEEPSLAEQRLALGDSDRVAQLRQRLSSPSWFMKALRENIARRANASDQTTGAFWDGRFRCRRLEDETAILICGIYVDLNQIRAGEAATPEESRYTSAFDRIAGKQAREADAASHGDSMGAVDLQLSAADGWLGQLSITTGDAADPPYQTRSRNGRRASDKGLLELTLDQYLDLLEWIGRQICGNKSGAIPNPLTPILERLKIRGDCWLDLIQNFDRWFSNFVGHIDRLQQAAARSGRLWVRGARQCAAAFLS